MQGYYIVTETIKAQLELDPFVNTVNTGIIEDVLLKKADMYPYSHILVNNSSYQGNTWVFNLSVICMDIVDLSKDEVTEVFYGNDNQQDVLNTQLAVINRMLDVLQRGQNTKSYILDGAPNCEPFIDRFEHGVAGWTVTFDIRIPNTMTVCSTDVTPVKLCPDFTYLIKDSADNTLYTGSILSGNGLTQTITDGEVTNTLGTVLGNVLAQGSLELADVNNIDSDGSTVPTPAGVAFTCTPVAPCEDATLTLNTGAFLTVASGSTTDIELIDQDDTPIVPISVIGSVIKVDIPVTVLPIGATLMKTGATVSVATGDDGDLQNGRPDNFLTLPSAPVHLDGSVTMNTTTFRFTDTLGGQTYANNIFLDWSTWNGTNLNGYYFSPDTLGYCIWSVFISNCNSFSTVDFPSGWYAPNAMEMFSLVNQGSNQALNYAPFNWNIGYQFWTSTSSSNAPNPITGSAKAIVSVRQSLEQSSKSSNYYFIPCRKFTVTGTTLS